jgi:hypothetical protein
MYLTANMETHANHLHHAPGKKFWHYFYEFLMLFLAVFCGFLAENVREHRVEAERADQYIISFYEDLKSDTTEISRAMEYDERKVIGLNNMINCYDTINKNWKATSCLWDLVKKSQTNRVFQLTGRTLKQLANAGGFRLLRKEDSDSIISYESQFNAFADFQSTAFQEAQDNARNTFSMIIDFKANAQIQGTSVGVGTTKIDSKLPLLFSPDKKLLNKYFNELLLYLRAIKGHHSQLEKLKMKAISLIEFYKNKYQLG